MEFEWDETKNNSNIEKHGVSFATACRIFEGPTLDRIDDRRDYGEPRTISLGMIEDLLVVVVVHTHRRGTTRIISARLAKRSERLIYAKAIQQ